MQNYSAQCVPGCVRAFSMQSHLMTSRRRGIRRKNRLHPRSADTGSCTVQRDANCCRNQPAAHVAVVDLAFVEAEHVTALTDSGAVVADSAALRTSWAQLVEACAVGRGFHRRVSHQKPMNGVCVFCNSSGIVANVGEAPVRIRWHAM